MRSRSRRAPGHRPAERDRCVPRGYDAAMRLTAWEEERLLIFTAAELARRHRDRGILLNAPEVIAIVCDAMLDAARAGASYEEIERAGREAVTAEQALPGVP